MNTRSTDPLQEGHSLDGIANQLQRRAGRRLALLGTVLVLCGAGLTVAYRSKEGAPATVNQPVKPPTKFIPPATYAELCVLPLADVEKCDIALLNLLCSEGLKGSETPSIPECLATIDQWAAQIKSETERTLHRFYETPDKFRNCEGYFRMAMLVTVLKQDLQVHYDEARSNDEPTESFFADSGSTFIKGMLGSRRTGTCASIPVLIVALGKRLGYPVKLVAARAHSFVRWEDGEDRFNIEATNGGMTTHPDEYYMTWPKPITEEMLASEGFLQSMTPVQVLGIFLQTRSICLFVNGRKAEVRKACQKGLECLPASKMFNCSF